MDEKFLSKVVTSGEAAMQAVNQHKFGKNFYHLGPIRDNSIFKKVEENKTNASFVVCVSSAFVCVKKGFLLREFSSMRTLSESF